MEALRIGLAVRVRGKRGVIKFVGKTQFAPGVWVGVELIEPTGKNNGSLNGVEYFTCSKPGNYGIFVSPALVDTSTKGTSLESSPIKSPSRSKSPEVDDTTAKIYHYKLIIDRLQLKLQESFKDIKEYKLQIEQLNSKLEDSGPTLESKIDELQVDRDYFKQENEALKENLKSLQAKNESLIKELDQIRQDLELVKQIDEEIDSLINQDFTNDNLDTLISKNRSLQITLQKLKNISMDKELSLLDELDRLNTKLDGGISKEAYQEVHKKLIQSEETIQELKSHLDSINDLETIITHLTTENEQLSTRIDQLQSQLVELTELQQIDKDLEEGHVQIESNLRQTINNLQQKIIEETKKREDLQFKLNDVNNKLSSTSANNDTSYPTDELVKLLELSRLDLSAKIRDLKYSNLLLEIANTKLEVLENLELLPNDLTLPINSLKPILNSIEDLIDQSETFGERFKLKQIFYNLKALALVGVQVSTEDKDKHQKFVASLNGILDELLLRIKNYTLGEYKSEPILKLIEQMFGGLVSNLSYNELFLSFLGCEIEIVSNFLTFIRPLNAPHIDDLNVVINKLSEKIKTIRLSSDRNREVNERYQYEGYRDRFVTSKIIELCNGNFDFENLEDTFNQDREKLVGGIDDLMSVFQVCLYKLDQEFTPASRDKDGKFEELTTKKTDEPLQSVTDEIIKKDRTIKDLEIAIELLNNNLKISSNNFQSKLETVTTELNGIKLNYNSLTKDYNNSINENKHLRAEIDKFLSSGKYFDLAFTVGKFDSIKLETSFNDNLKLIEENNYLRKVINKSLRGPKSSHDETDNLSWLESTTADKVNDVHRRRVNLDELSSRLQKISNSVEQFELPMNSWKPKKENPKFILSAIKEQYYKYENDRNNLLL